MRFPVSTAVAAMRLPKDERWFRSVRLAEACPPLQCELQGAVISKCDQISQVYRDTACTRPAARSPLCNQQAADCLPA